MNSDVDIDIYGRLVLYTEDAEENGRWSTIGDALDDLTLDDPRLSNVIELAVDVVAAYREAVAYGDDCAAEARSCWEFSRGRP